MKNDFTGTTATKTGIPVRDVKFLSIPGVWGGQVQDPQHTKPGSWTTAAWDKNGKCKNRSRADLDLK